MTVYQVKVNGKPILVTTNARRAQWCAAEERVKGGKVEIVDRVKPDRKDRR